MDGKFIKDMYYSTESLVPFINFEVISGDINTIGSTMVVKYGDKEYTETVKDAAEQGSSEHKPYIGFKLGLEQKPTEEHPFCYGVNIALEGNIKQLFCAAPKTVSENDVIVYNGKNKTVKKITEDSVSLLYVGNLHLLNTGFEDTGEQYLTLFDYISLETQGQLDLVASVVPQDGISCEVKVGNINYINPKYIKDMYYTKPESDVEKVLIFKGEIDQIAAMSVLFEAGDMISLKEAESGLDVFVEAESTTIDGTYVTYIGNISLLGTGGVDTKETYCAHYFYYKENENEEGVYVLGYFNKNHDAPNNIEMYKVANTVVRIPEKYLPKSVAKKDYVDTAISNAITKTLNTEV